MYAQKAIYTYPERLEEIASCVPTKRIALRLFHLKKLKFSSGEFLGS